MNELIIKSYDIAQPEQMVKMSKILKDHIVQQKLYTTIVGKNYVHVEGWQFAGGLLGLYPRITNVENLSNDKETKWKATAEIIRSVDNFVMSSGFAVCSNKEGRKKSFDEYAVLSMSQTRAIGKAYRNLIGWVMKLSGYESTPAEEMGAEDKESKLFEDTKSLIGKLPKDKRENAIKRAIDSKQFTDEQNEELKNL
jgi:hypothetical protein